jgi:hypothetical protein
VNLASVRGVQITSRPGHASTWHRQKARDYRLVEVFRFDRGRWPEGPKDGGAWWALKRLQRANLLEQVAVARVTRESSDTMRWRRWTGAQLAHALSGRLSFVRLVT